MPVKPQAISNVVLVGMMGSGKSTVGRILAQALNWNFVDTDQLVEQEFAASVEDIFSVHGEQAFRECESDVIGKVAQGNRQVVATGGGAVLLAKNRQLLWADSCVVWLDAQPAELAARVGVNPSTRPLVAGTDLEQRLKSILEARKALYSLAHIRVSTDGLEPAAVANEIRVQLSGVSASSN